MVFLGSDHSFGGIIIIKIYFNRILVTKRCVILLSPPFLSSYSQKKKKGKMKHIKHGVAKATSPEASKVECDCNAYDAIAQGHVVSYT